ncbi:hypothetical protein E2320_000239 [Naja naja]|nr:hypothetical protein E2320_000239 [Naja naja]
MYANILQPPKWRVEVYTTALKRGCLRIILPTLRNLNWKRLLSGVELGHRHPSENTDLPLGQSKQIPLDSSNSDDY